MGFLDGLLGVGLAAMALDLQTQDVRAEQGDSEFDIFRKKMERFKEIQEDKKNEWLREKERERARRERRTKEDAT